MKRAITSVESGDATELRPRGMNAWDQRLSGASNEAVSDQAAPPSSVAMWLCGLLQAGDSFYPTGSYAHSFGLEGLVQEDVIRDRETLRAFLLHTTIPALRHVDIPIAAHAWRALSNQDWRRVGELCVLSSALRTSRETRAALENIGRQRTELAATLHDSPLARDYLRQASERAWPGSMAVAAALEGRILGAPIDAVLAGVFYSNVMSLLSAAMKILRLGQNSCQTLLTEALALAPGVITEAQHTPIEQIGWFNPWLDIAAARHENADARMFIS
jgi:urease accessory protein